MTDEEIPIEQASPEQEAEAPYIDEPGENVQGLYNLKASNLLNTNRSRGALALGGRKSYDNPPNYAIEAAEQAVAAHYGDAPPPVPQPKVKRYQANGQRIEYSEEKILPTQPVGASAPSNIIYEKMTPEQKLYLAEQVQVAKEAEAARVEAARDAQEQGQKPLGPRPMSEHAKEEFRHREADRQTAERKLEFEKQKEERLRTKENAENVRAQARFEQEQKEKEYAQAKAQYEYSKKMAEEQAGRPLSDAEFQTKLITAQQGLRVKQAEEKRYQFRQTPIGKITTSVENVATGLAGGLNGIKENLQAAAKGAQPNIAEIRGQFLPAENPNNTVSALPTTVPVAQAQPEQGSVSPYRQASYDIGGTPVGYTSSEVLTNVGGHGVGRGGEATLDAIGSPRRQVGIMQEQG